MASFCLGLMSVIILCKFFYVITVKLPDEACVDDALKYVPVVFFSFVFGRILSN